MENTNSNPAALTKAALIAQNEELKAALEKAQAPASKVITRRVYAQHNVYGSCVTIGANVYLAPAGVVFDKKQVVKLQFTVTGDVVRDSEGREWLCGGENGGCGPRLPKALKDRYPNWHSMSFHQRAEILKALVPAPAAPAPEQAATQETPAS